MPQFTAFIISFTPNVKRMPVSLNSCTLYIVTCRTIANRIIVKPYVVQICSFRMIQIGNIQNQGPEQKERYHNADDINQNISQNSNDMFCILCFYKTNNKYSQRNNGQHNAPYDLLEKASRAKNKICVVLKKGICNAKKNNEDNNCNKPKGRKDNGLIRSIHIIFIQCRPPPQRTILNYIIRLAR